MYVGIEQLLVGLVSSYRYDREKIDLGLANSEADMLCESIEERQLDQENVTRILSTRNFFQLRATCACYKQKYGSSIYQVHPSSYFFIYALLVQSLWAFPFFFFKIWFIDYASSLSTDLLDIFNSRLRVVC